MRSTIAADHLKTFGYARLDNVLPPARCDELAAALDEISEDRRAAGTAYEPGGQVVVYDPTLERPDLFLPVIAIPSILDTVEAILGPDIILGCVSGSKSAPDRGGTFGPHIDGSLAVRDTDHTTNVMMAVCLDEFTETNGATRVWPLSHRTGTRIQKAEWRTQLPAPVIMTAPRGSAVMWLGETWHQVGPNSDGTRRWGLLLAYTHWWIKPTFDFTQCGAEMYARLTPMQKKLFGFTSRPPRSSQGRYGRYRTLTRVEDLPADYAEALRT